MSHPLSAADRRQVRDILRLAADYDEAVAAIAARGEQNRENALCALQGLSDRELGRTLRGMAVETVNREKLGIRVSYLRAAGIENMEQLCALSAEQINAIRGIGDEAAYLIATIAGRIRSEAGKGLKIRLSAEERDAESTALLRAVHTLLQEEAETETACRLYEQYHGLITEAALEARTAAGSLRWFFASARKKDAASEASRALYDLVTGDYGEAVRELTRRFDALESPDDAALWENYLNRSAAFYARLDRLCREQGTAVDNSSGDLPEELVRKVEQEALQLDTLRATLRGYQEFGVRYILHQGKVLLGDEMGLGKTVQAIAAMVSLHAQGATHFLVVCPASVLVNWAREIRQFSALPVTGIRGGNLTAFLQWQNTGGVAVTTYESISRFALPEGFSLALLVADEAHYVKNPGALRTQALRILARHARRLLFMTGTPLENRVEELCNLVGMLRPELAGELREMKYISAAPQFREKLAPVYLRRTREAVLGELPEKIEKEQWVELSMGEWKNYLLSVGAENFMAMRQVSWDCAKVKDSAKARRLLELCEDAGNEGRKILAFSFFRHTLDSAREILGSRALEPITGSVSPAKRQALVDAFTAAPAGTVLLCQIQAGGTGLNIQAASVVIFCEPQIKPSLETQAISRAYRMGQARSVLVYRLLAENTVDERILELLREKQEQFDLYAEKSAAGSEAIRSEQTLARALIEQEKERLKELQEAASLLPPLRQKEDSDTVSS